MAQALAGEVTVAMKRSSWRPRRKAGKYAAEREDPELGKLFSCFRVGDRVCYIFDRGIRYKPVDEQHQATGEVP